jgi:hypothetical protein
MAFLPASGLSALSWAAMIPVHVPRAAGIALAIGVICTTSLSAPGKPGAGDDDFQCPGRTDSTVSAGDEPDMKINLKVRNRRGQ